MKWGLLVSGSFLLFVSWAIVQIGKGFTFAYGGYQVWDRDFIARYNACCLLTDLKAAAPFAVLGVFFLCLSAWQFRRKK